MKPKRKRQKVVVPPELLRLANAVDEFRDALLAVLTGHPVAKGVLSVVLPRAEVSSVPALLRPLTRDSAAAKMGQEFNGGATGPPIGPTGLNRCEMAILGVLVERYPKTTTARQVAIFTGYRQSGSFAGALTALRAGGYIQGSRSDLVATDAGRDICIPPRRPAPGPELVEDWCSRLESAERTILRVVVAAYPAAIAKREIAARADYRESGSFAGALTKLKGLELIRKVGSSDAGPVFSLSPELMGDGS